MTGFGWEVRAAIKGATIGREENGHRPAAMSTKGLHRLHIDVVHVRAFFAVYLDIDKEFIHLVGGDGILKTLVRHNMTPMAGAIANAEQNGLIFGLRAWKASPSRDTNRRGYRRAATDRGWFRVGGGWA